MHKKIQGKKTEFSHKVYGLRLNVDITLHPTTIKFSHTSIRKLGRGVRRRSIMQNIMTMVTSCFQIQRRQSVAVGCQTLLPEVHSRARSPHLPPYPRELPVQ